MGSVPIANYSNFEFFPLMWFDPVNEFRVKQRFGFLGIIESPGKKT